MVVDTLGQPIPIGEAMKQQEAKSRSESAQQVGKAGANRLAKDADDKANAASATTQASAASSVPGASGAAAANAPQPAIAPYAIGWTVKGTYNRMPVSGSGKVGGVLALQDANRPFPVQADVKAGDLRIALVGTVTDPAHLAAGRPAFVAARHEPRSSVWPDGHHAARDAAVRNRRPPHWSVQADGNVFTYENFTGRVGGSDLNGTLTYVGREPRPLLQGELVSNLLRFSDLAPIIGADSNASKAKRGDAQRQPSNKALPAEPFHTERWTAIDADVKLTGRRIVKDPSLPITDLYTHVVMKDGVLTLEPLKFGVAGGSIASNIVLDGSGTPLKGRFSTSARHIKLKQLFPTVKTMQSALGEVNGDAALSATGNSPAALAATSNGEVKALVTDGTVSRLLMEAAGLNVANVVYEKLFGKRDVQINCAAADFVVTDGVLDSRVFALDTTDAVINIDGHVNMRDETLDLGVHPHTKGFRMFSLRSPLYAKGTFKDPHVGVDAAALALRGGAMVGLGLINPFAALIPLIAPSNNKPLPCDELLANMRARPTAPPPGQKQQAKAPLLPAQGASGAAADVAKPPAAQRTEPPAKAAEYKGS